MEELFASVNAFKRHSNNGIIYMPLGLFSFLSGVYIFLKFYLALIYTMLTIFFSTFKSRQGKMIELKQIVGVDPALSNKFAPLLRRSAGSWIFQHQFPIKSLVLFKCSWQLLSIVSRGAHT